jgi:predicted metal-dependent hydrolase
VPDHVFPAGAQVLVIMNRGERGSVAGKTTIVLKPVRSARLQVRPDGSLRVVAPPSFDVEGFLQRNAAWIENRRRELDRLAAEGCGREDLLLLHGRFCRVVPGARFAVDEDSGTVASPSVPALRRGLSRMLKEEVRKRLEACPALTGRWQGRIAVKMQKTRWGSCSTLGNVNVNLRLVALPETLREYVVVHEAAHLREQNHSRRFWRLVGEHYPDYRAAEAELRRYWIILERNRVWKALGEAG